MHKHFLYRKAVGYGLLLSICATRKSTQSRLDEQCVADMVAKEGEKRTATLSPVIDHATLIKQVVVYLRPVAVDPSGTRRSIAFVLGRLLRHRLALAII